MMDLDLALGLFKAALEDLAEQLERPQDLFHYHRATATDSTYRAVLALLEPVRDMTGAELRLQGAYLSGIAEACERAAQLMRQVESARREPAGRKRAEEALTKAHEDLERLVEERTAELSRTNAVLKREINERKRYFRSLIHKVFDIIAILNGDGSMRYVSPSVEHLLGCKPEELIGKSCFEFASPQDAPNVIEAFAHVIQSLGASLFIETRLRHKDGSWRTFEAAGQNLLDNPAVAGVTICFRDISQRSQAENGLRDSQAQLSAIHDKAPIIMILVDRERRVREVNGAAARFAGRPVEEMIGLRGGEAIRCLYSLDDPKGCGFGPFCETCALCRTVLDTFETGKDHYQVEARLPFARGEKQEELHLLVSATLLSIRNEERVLVCLEDITEHKRAEEGFKQGLEKLQRVLEGTVQAMALTVEMRDPHTAGHQRRVTQLACAIAQEMGLLEEQIEGIRIAGLLHDIGKISVPSEILSKPGEISESEFHMIKDHPQVGSDILKTVEFPWPVSPIVLQHHERLDGSGYPSGLSDKQILPEARLLIVADVVEAMASHRPYRPALGLDRALEEISQNRGKLYDPHVVDACLRVFAEKGFEFE